MKVFMKRKEKEWTDFQRRLDIFLEEEDAELQERYKEAVKNKNIKLGGEILLQRINILCIREKAGIYW